MISGRRGVCVTRTCWKAMGMFEGFRRRWRERHDRAVAFQACGGARLSVSTGRLEVVQTGGAGRHPGARGVAGSAPGDDARDDDRGVHRPRPRAGADSTGDFGLERVRGGARGVGPLECAAAGGAAGARRCDQPSAAKGPCGDGAGVRSAAAGMERPRRLRNRAGTCGCGVSRHRTHGDRRLPAVPCVPRRTGTGPAGTGARRAAFPKRARRSGKCAAATARRCL